MSNMHICRNLLVVCTLITSAHAAELLVIASTAPTYGRGLVLEGGESVHIGAGETLTLIASNGKTLRLSGPYRGTVSTVTTAPADTGLLEALTELVKRQGESDPTLATFRNLKKKSLPQRPDIWGVNVSTTGRYCVRGELPVSLWRPSAPYSAVLTISRIKRMSRF